MRHISFFVCKIRAFTGIFSLFVYKILLPLSLYVNFTYKLSHKAVLYISVAPLLRKLCRGPGVTALSKPDPEDNEAGIRITPANI